MYLEGDGIAVNKEEAESLIKEAYLNGKYEAKIILDKEHWSVEPKGETLPEE